MDIYSQYVLVLSATMVNSAESVYPLLSFSCFISLFVHTLTFQCLLIYSSLHSNIPVLGLPEHTIAIHHLLQWNLSLFHIWTTDKFCRKFIMRKIYDIICSFSATTCGGWQWQRQRRSILYSLHSVPSIKTFHQLSCGQCTCKSEILTNRFAIGPDSHMPCDQSILLNSIICQFKIFRTLIFPTVYNNSNNEWNFSLNNRY